MVDGLTQIEVGGERLVIGGPFRGTHVLNEWGVLVWQFLDGTVRLAELIDDLVAATGTPREIVAPDVVQFAQELGRSGLLTGVGETGVEPAPADAVALPVPLEPGTEVVASLTDLDGTRRSLTELRGRRVLLVNWNPGCGFCESIAGPLAALEPDLEAAGVQTVFVASGDLDANRALAERAGLRLVRLRSADADPFGGLGTPVAVVLDEAGRVASPLAQGALEVLTEAGRLAGVEMPAEGLLGGPDRKSVV